MIIETHKMALGSIKRIFSSILEKEQFHCSKCNQINSKESAFCKKCGAKINKKDSSKGESKAFGYSRNMRNVGIVCLFIGILLIIPVLILNLSRIFALPYSYSIQSSILGLAGLFVVIGFPIYILGWVLGGIIVLVGKQNSK
jgi:hypothetical protein